MNVNKEGPTVDDHKPLSTLHGVLECIAFLFTFSLAVVAARIVEKIRLHAAIQALGFTVVLADLTSGLYTGIYYNRSKHVSNGHQIADLILVRILFAQLGAGFLHHRHFSKHGAPMRGGIVIRMHQVVGPLAIAAGVINGAFGFRFALTSWNKVYDPTVIGVAILLVTSVGVKVLLRREKGEKLSHVEGLAASAGYTQPPAYSSAPAPPYGGPSPNFARSPGAPLVSRPYSKFELGRERHGVAVNATRDSKADDLMNAHDRSRPFVILGQVWRFGQVKDYGGIS